MSFPNSTVLNNSSSIINSTESTDLSLKYVLVLPLLILMMLATCGANIVVMACVLVEKTLRKPFNYYVISLAVADFLVGSFVSGNMVVYTLYGYWPLGKVMCILWESVDFSSVCTSILHICLLAHDRHQVIVYPLTYYKVNQKRRVMIRIGLVWSVAFLTWVPPIVTLNIIDNYSALECFFLPDKIIVLIWTILAYYAPITVMVVFYIKCVVGLEVHFKKMKALSTEDLRRNTRSLEDITDITDVASNATNEDLDDLSTKTSSLSCVRNMKDTNAICQEGEVVLQVKGLETLDTSDKTSTNSENDKDADKMKDLKAMRTQRRSHVRAIRTLGTIIAMFLFCWVPFCVFWPVSAFCGDCIPYEAYEYSYWAAYLNSMINPFLYFICNEKYRLAFRTLVKTMKNKIRQD